MCKIKGPYLPSGDIDWTCSVHNVLAELIDATKYGKGPHKRENFFCPIGESNAKN